MMKVCQRLEEDIVFSFNDISKACTTENFITVWLGPQVNKSQNDYQKSITYLLRYVNFIETFINSDQSYCHT
jgi:hypothetical protein